MEIPKLSVLIVTYNHEKYIAQAVESALAQRTDFPIEIVVGEDASTDKTRQILVELARQHPERLRLLLHERNLGGPENVAAVLEACRGQYVAMLEGDDYWTHPLKLQKQVALLDAHPEWAMCFHLARVVHEDDSRPPQVYPAHWTKDVASIDDLFIQNFIGTCSVVFRNGLFGRLPAWHREITAGDWAIHLLNADRGLIGFLPGVLGDYRVHARGAWSGRTPGERHADILAMLSRVDRHFGGKYSGPIEEHRRRLVISLALQVETLEKQLIDLRTTVDELRSRVVSTATPGPVVSTTTPRPKRSAVYEMSRAVLRPVERVGRRVGEAIGIRHKAS